MRNKPLHFFTCPKGEKVICNTHLLFTFYFKLYSICCRCQNRHRSKSSYGTRLARWRDATAARSRPTRHLSTRKSVLRTYTSLVSSSIRLLLLVSYLPQLPIFNLQQDVNRARFRYEYILFCNVFCIFANLRQQVWIFRAYFILQNLVKFSFERNNFKRYLARN